MSVCYRFLICFATISFVIVLISNRNTVDDYVYKINNKIRSQNENKLELNHRNEIIGQTDDQKRGKEEDKNKIKQREEAQKVEEAKLIDAHLDKHVEHALVNGTIEHYHLYKGNLSKLESMECRLPDLNPWNDYALPYINKGRDRMWGCAVTYERITYLKEGKIYLTKEEIGNGTRCIYKCLYPKNDFEYSQGPWKKIGEEVDCDVMEVNCTRPNSTFFYNTLHTQIHRQFHYLQKPTLPPTTTTPPDVLPVKKHDQKKKPLAPPDVHIILFDSVSTTQFIRSMPATVNVLKDEMEAVVFPHVNKVGINSRPNGYALLMGRQGYVLEKSPITNERKPWKSMYDYCGFYLEEDQFIGFEFKKKGYATLFSEDWELGVFNWPNCFGFGKTPVDHYMRPFQLRLESSKYRDENATLKNHLYWERCKEAHQYQMNYLEEFINVYPDKPKFSLTWFTYLAHDDANGLFHVDLQFQKFFRSYKEKLSNSYLFVMGDHGYRFGGIRRTKLGEAEDKNPLLMVVVPEHLRDNENLIKNMKRNSKHLTTHFDTFATFANIAHEATKFDVNTKFDGFDHSHIPLHIEGESYFHPYKLDKPRNCGNQNVPFDFCNCQLVEKDVSAETSFAEKISTYAVEVMNAALVEQNHTHKCASLSLNYTHPIEVSEFEPQLNFNAYKVTFKVLPGDGHLWGYVQAYGDRNSTNVKFSMISERLARLDEYEPTAFCSNSPYVKPYCYCKELFSRTTTTTKASPAKKSDPGLKLKT